VSSIFCLSVSYLSVPLPRAHEEGWLVQFPPQVRAGWYCITAPVEYVYAVFSSSIKHRFGGGGDRNSDGGQKWRIGMRERRKEMVERDLGKEIEEMNEGKGERDGREGFRE
jgi:hypothetical protein